MIDIIIAISNGKNIFLSAIVLFPIFALRHKGFANRVQLMHNFTTRSVNTLDFNKQLHQARHAAQSRQFPDALKLYGALSREFPGLGNLWEEYGRTASVAGEHELADQCWQKALEIGPRNAELLLRLVEQYGKIWLFDKARALSREAAELEPNNLMVQINLASLMSRSGSTAEAREAAERCLKLDPNSEQARYFAAVLDRRENKLEQAEQAFRDLLGSNLRDSHTRYFSHLELARTLDSMGRYHQAMAELKIAKRLAAQTMKLDEERKRFDERREKALGVARSLPKNILRQWEKSFPPQSRCAAPPIAFLGGHPRSGTTLLERVLDAHPSIAAADESMAFHTISPLVDVNAPEIPAEGLNFIRQRYLRNFLKTMGALPEGKALLDKNPAMTPYLPPLLRAFPELRVVIALRDPRDVLVSCFFEPMIRFSHLSFENLAEYYACVMGVWLTLREWEGLNWTETRYEEIVKDLQKEGGRVTKFLGLEWHENQEQFHEKNREKPIISTGNYAGVTKPVYSRSMGRWREYEQYMESALPILKPFCKEFGYE